MEVDELFTIYDTSNVTSMEYMFYNCGSLESLDVSNFDTSKVQSMHGMFVGCSSLEKLDVSNFDTANVTHMAAMFANCESLLSMDVSSFDISKVVSVGNMFRNCTSLKSVDLSSFDTSNATYIYDMLSECNGLETIYTPQKMLEDQRIGLPYTFYDEEGNSTLLITAEFCNKKLTTTQPEVSIISGKLGDNNGIEWTYDSETKTLTITGEDSGVYGSYNSSIWGYESPFVASCSDVEKIVIKDCTLYGEVYALFANLYNFMEIEFDNFDTSEVTNKDNMFCWCRKLESLDLSCFDTSNVTSMYSMFEGCFSLESLNVSNFDTSNVTSMANMFMGCSNLKSLDVSNFDTSNVTGMYSMFRGCSNLESLDVSNYDTSNVINMASMFMNCSSLESLDVSSFDITNVTFMDDMLSECNSLETVYAPQKMSESQEIGLPHTFYDEEGNSTQLITAEFCNKKLTAKEPASFADAPETEWYYQYIKAAYERGYMTGTGTDEDGNVIFAPLVNIPREQFAQILYAMDSSDKSDVANSGRFDDVVSGMWYEAAVEWAAQQGIVSGVGDGKFGVGQEITREQIALMLFGYAKYKGYETTGRADISTFPDAADVSNWAQEALEWAIHYGIMSGKLAENGNCLAPQEKATRAECATMILAFVNMYEE